MQGSESSKKIFLKDNIEKIFLFPFLKLFEIFYASLGDKEKYNKLKIENFGEEFKNIKTLDPFEIQIKTLNELLFFSRPDILEHFESNFIKKYTVKELNENQNKYLYTQFAMYYTKAKDIQKDQDINCIDSDKGSIAREYSFPQNKKNYKKIKKLFMCKLDFFKNNIYILDNLDNSFIQNFFIEQLIRNTLYNIESSIQVSLNLDNNEKNFRDLLVKILENIMKNI